MIIYYNINKVMWLKYIGLILVSAFAGYTGKYLFGVETDV
jgi:hypothetical protein